MKRKDIRNFVEKHIEIRNEYKFDDLISWGDDEYLDFNMDDYNKLFDGDEKEVLNYPENPSLFYKLFNYPMLVLHELMHYLMVLIVIFEIPDIYLSNPMKELWGRVTYNPSDNYIKNILVSGAPSLLLLLAIGLPFINIYFLIFTLYTLFTYKHAISSQQDIRDINICLIGGKELMGYELMMIADVISSRE